jgi:predicted nucleic acid-binding protein
MILVDTSVWIDHLHRQEERMFSLLTEGRVVVHPFVIGELALGHLRQRETVLELLQNLPQAKLASDSEVLRLIDNEALHGRGIGYVDTHLLASTRLTPGARFWTRDKRLAAVAQGLGIAASPAH